MNKGKHKLKKRQSTRNKRHTLAVGICFEPLEPRLLLSGSWGAGVDASPAESQANTPDERGRETVALHADASISDTQASQQHQLQIIGRVDLLANAPVLKAFPAGEAIESADHGAATADRTQELIFVDTGIRNYEHLVDDIMAKADDDRAFEVIILEADRDGVDQISQALADRQDLDAVHFVTHGDGGAVKLGNTWLDSDNVDAYARDILGWHDSLSSEADLLFYGCDLAAGEDGRVLLDKLGNLTHADVAASDDLTGSALLGGDWELEFKKGTIETRVALATDDQVGWSGVLGQITVTTTNDTLDGDADTNNLTDLAANPGTDGEISLREAVKAANNNPDADTIYLQAGTYTITLVGSDDDSGDYDIREDLSIVGVSPATTIIDGNNGTTIFDVHDDAAISVSFSNLKIQDGRSTVLGEENGAGLYIKGSANKPEVHLSDVWFSGNNSTVVWGDGGAIYNAGNLTIDRGLIENNFGEKGGGIFNAAGGTLAMTNVTISGNQATVAEGGGLYNLGTAMLRNVTIAFNHSTTQGGGIFNTGTLDIGNSIVSNNTAGGSGPDVFGALASSGSNIFGNDATASGFQGSDQRNVDPLLGSLADNGGNLMTHAPGASAIDTADRSLMPTIDQRGFLRGDGSPDIGAYEASASATGTADYLDRFDAVAYNGDDGALPWSNDWQEIGEASDAAMGAVSVWNELGEQGLYLWAADDVGVWRQADLSGATTATLSFDWAMIKTELGDQASLQISTDGVVWDTLDTFDGPLDHSVMQSAIYDISAYIDNDTRIRFETISGFFNNDVFFVDNVRIELSPPAPVVANLSPIKDTYLNDNSPTSNYGTAASLVVDKAGGSLGDGRTLLQFDLSSIPAGATITSATLQLQATGTSGGAFDIDVYKVTQAWDEGLGGSDGANWDNRQTGTSWGTAGGSVDTTPPSPPTFAATTTGQHTWDVTSLVEDWLTPGNPNYGLMLASDDLGTESFTYDSREGGTPPQLVITYTLGVGAPKANNDSYSTDQDTTLAIDAAAGLLANDTDPNLDTLSATLVTGPSNGTLTINPTGVTDETNLTNNGGTDTQPEWSPDGTKVAFVSGRDGNDEIYVINADGTGLQRLTTNGAQDFDISWSKDGSKIAFASDRDGNMEIYTMNADGSGQNRVTFEIGSTDQRPEWSPDGTQFVFQSNRDGDWDIFTMNVDGSNPVNLTPGTGDESGPTWSPDGTKIAYRSYTGGNYDIYVMDADGGNKIRLTTHAGIDNTPHWSPDGTKIIFETERDGDYELFAIDPDGSNLTRLTSTTSDETAIVWSPDGTRFAYESDRDGNKEIYVGEIVSDGAFSYTPDAGFSGVDTFTYIASDGSNDSGAATATITVNAAPNLAPTFTSFSAPVDFTDEATEVEITFADLEAEGDEDDSDGTVGAFVVKSLASGTLKIGASAGTATAFAVDSNDTINAANNAYWTPAPGANGTLNAFAVVAEDDVGAESITPVTVAVAVSANPVVNDQGLSVDENALSGTPVGTIAATAGDPAHNYSKLYWVDVDTDELRRIELDGTLNQTLADQSDGTAATGPRSVTVDDVNGHVYWTNNNSGEIWRANLDGSSAAPVLTGLASPMGIAVDPSGEKIYWFDAAANELWRADLDGSNAAALITTGISTPKALAIDATGGKVYWTNNGSSPGLGEIKRADLDGSNMETVTSGLDAPHSIALDTVRGKVYWAEPGLQEIHRADMAAGVGSETVVVGLGEPRAVAVDALRGKLYWADAGTDRIERANLDGSAAELVTGTGQWPLSIALGPPTQNLTYTITAGNTNGAFALDPVTGELTVANSSELDFETTPAFNLTVTVTDAGGHSDNGTITVDLNDINDAPVINDATFNVDENSTNGTAVGNVSVTDPDAGDSHVYSITVGNTGGAFAIDNAGNITVANAAALNFETNPVFTLTVQVQDQGGTGIIDTATITVNLNDINDAPVLGAIGNQTIDELNPLTFTASATDSDLPANTLTYTLDATSIAAGMTIDGVTGDFSWTPTEGQSGVHSVTITVTDDGTGTLADNETFNITVNEVNVAPVLGAIGNQTIDELNPLTFTASATDSDLPANTLTYTLDATSLAAGMTIDGVTGDFSWTPTEGQSGVHSVTITVTDDGTGTLADNETFNITVNEINVAPVLSAIGNQSVDELNPLTFTATATDTDLPANTLTYTLDATSLAAGMTIDGVTGDFSWTPTEGQSGVHSVTITVTDNGTGTLADNETFNITVNEVNVAPVLGAIGNQTIDELNPLTFTASATDSDLPANTLTYTLDATSLAAGMTIDGVTGDFSWTPTEGQSGVHSVTITVTDDGTGTLSDFETFNITVNAVNVAPVLGAIGNQTIDELNPLTFTASATDSDLPANALTYTLDATSIAAGMIIDANTGDFSWIPTEGQGGVHSVTINVTDDGIGTLNDFETFNITVNDVNNAPVLTAIGNQAIDELTPLTFTASATDSDLPADTLTYTLDATSLAAGMTIDANTGDFSWTPTEGQSGVHSVTVTVTDDGTGTLSDNETFNITVNEVNVAPVLGAIGNQTIDELNPLSFTASATDADLPANTLTYTLDATSLAAGMTIDAGTGDFSWTPAEAQNGVHSVTVTVTDDGTGTLTDSETFNITVNELNVAPVLGAIGNQSVDELATLTFTASATDADLPANILTYSLDATSLAAGMTIDANTGDFSWTPAEAQSGVHSVTVTVTDDGTGTLTDSETFNITVNEINVAPVVVADSFTVNEGSTTNLNLAGNDSDADDGLDLASITIVSSPSNGIINSINADGTVDYTHDGSETLSDSFTYTIDDLSTATSNTVTVSLTITPVNDSPKIALINMTTTLYEDMDTSSTIKVADIMVTDDAMGTNDLSLIGADAALFEIVGGNELHLKAGAILDYVTNPNLDVTVSVNDAAVGGTSDDTVALNISVAAAVTVTPPPTTESPSTPPEVGEVAEPAPDITPEESENVAEPEEAPVEDVPEAAAPPVDPDAAEEPVMRNRGITNARVSYLVPTRTNLSPTQVAGVNVEDIAERLSEKAAAPEKLEAAYSAQQRAERLVQAQNQMSARTYLNMVTSLNDVKKEVAGDIAFKKTLLGSAIAMSTGLSVGYVVWLVRGGMLLSTLLSSIPAWQILDPLPILARRNDDDESDDDESLESILGQKPPKPDKKEKTPEPSSEVSSDAELKKDSP